jgi:hypothetical protein
VLLTGYHLAIRAGWVPATNGVQLRDHNRIRCENYLLDPAVRPEIVLAGSSLTANLPIDDVDPAIFNLGLAGDCAWTGIELIRAHTQHLPRIVAIEVGDPLLREPDHALLDTLLNPYWRAIHRAAPMLQTKYQPVGVFMKAAGRWGKHRIGTGPEIDGKAAPGAADQPVSMVQTEAVISPLGKQLVAEAKATMDAPINLEGDGPVRSVCAKLRAAIAQMTASGIQCVLMAVPGDASLEDTRAYGHWQEIIRQELPAERYQWVPPLAGFKGRTNDAVHLIPQDAVIYARYLSAYLEGIARKTTGRP